MIVDVFVLVDDAPVILRRPLLPFSPKSYRIPIFAKHEPAAQNWPIYPWYSTNDITETIATVLIGGRSFEKSYNKVPPPQFYTIHVEENASYLCIGFEKETLWMYERIEIVITDEIVYSLRGVKDDDGSPNPPMILSVPDIKKKADALKYAKFSFEQTKVQFIKENQSIFLYGGEMNISLRAKETESGLHENFPMGKYVIDKVSHNQDTAALTGLDYRSLLNAKYPAETFWGTVEEQIRFPYLEEKYRNQIKPACIGIGNGIPGICLNGLQIYESLIPPLVEITRYDFQFPPGFIIDDNFKIEVKASGTPTVEELRPTDTWIEIYPGLGNPHYNQGYKAKNPHLDHSHIDSQTGIVSVYFRQALANGQYGNNPNEIRMFARWPNQRMRDAIAALLGLANEQLEHDLRYVSQSEFPDQLADIGLYMNESKSIFEWIERIQSGNIIGGQLMLVNDVLTYRLENPNRLKKRRRNNEPMDIPRQDVLNHEDLGVSMADEFIYSGFDVSYIKTWNNDGRGHIIGVNQRYPNAETFIGEDLTARFIRRNHSFDVSTVRQRANIIDNLIRTFRHKITGLELPMTFDYLDLLVYDVVGYTPKVLENTGQEYEWIIYSKKINLRNETIALDLVQRVRTDFWNNGNP